MGRKRKVGLIYAIIPKADNLLSAPNQPRASRIRGPPLGPCAWKQFLLIFLRFARPYIGGRAALAAAFLFAGGAVLVRLGLMGGYEVTSAIVWDGPSNPLGKTVIADASAWLRNFHAMPALCLVPALGIVAPLVAAAGFSTRREGLTFLASKLGVICIIATVGLAMFPIILPSSTNPGHSLAVFDASASGRHCETC